MKMEEQRSAVVQIEQQHSFTADRVLFEDHGIVTYVKDTDGDWNANFFPYHRVMYVAWNRPGTEVF